MIRAGQPWQHKEDKNSDKQEKARELHYGDTVGIRKLTGFEELLLLVQ